MCSVVQAESTSPRPRSVLRAPHRSHHPHYGRPLRSHRFRWEHPKNHGRLYPAKTVSLIWPQWQRGDVSQGSRRAGLFKTADPVAREQFRTQYSMTATQLYSLIWSCLLPSYSEWIDEASESCALSSSSPLRGLKNHKHTGTSERVVTLFARARESHTPACTQHEADTRTPTTRAMVPQIRSGCVTAPVNTTRLLNATPHR